MAFSDHNWTITHNANKSYTVECLDFTSREKAVTLKTANKNMTGDVDIAISAKEGSLSLNEASITATPTLDYTNNIVSFSGSGSVTTTFTKGWIEDDPEACQVSASGSLELSVTDDIEFTADRYKHTYSNDNAYYKVVKTRAIRLKPVESGVKNSSHDTNHKLYNDQMFIAHTGGATGEHCWFTHIGPFVEQGDFALDSSGYIEKVTGLQIGAYIYCDYTYNSGNYRYSRWKVWTGSGTYSLGYSRKSGSLSRDYIYVRYEREHNDEYYSIVGIESDLSSN